MSLLDTGISGLLASQRALATASHNISNVTTEGYSRQRVNLETRIPSEYGYGFVGNGVQVDSINRVYDQFINNQITNGTSDFNYYDTYNQLASRIDNILADPQAGLMPGIQNFFNSIQDLADDPSSSATRQVVLSEANALVDRFHYLSDGLNDLKVAVNNDIRNNVTDINSLAQALADTNKKISDLRSIGNGEPNDLLDQRDLLVNQLAEKVDVTTVIQDDGIINVFVGNGQAIVAGFDNFELAAMKNEFNPSRVDVGYQLAVGTVNITSNITGGTLGGALDFRGDIIESAENTLGYIAMGLANTFNNQHNIGLDLNSNLGNNFFNDISSDAPIVYSNNGNTGVPAANITAVITDINNVKISDYQLQNQAGTYTLTRLSDNQIFTLSSFPGSPETVDGITLSLSSGVIASGDIFQIDPVRSASSDIGLSIFDPSRIAAASPVRANINLANIGNGAINNGVINDITLYDGDTYAINFTTANTIEVRDSSSNLELSAAYVEGSPITFNGIEVVITGTPLAGDSFNVEPNTNGVSDNRNALSLALLQSQDVLLNSTISYEGIYGQIITDVGTKTRQAEISRDAQESLLNNSITAREAKSGVNLDEEASNLIRYQQLYQASAQLIAAADNTFNSLIDVLRR